MVEGIHKNITFYKVFKVFFRLYGLYLIITGLMSILAILPYYIKITEMKDYYWITKSDEAAYGLVDFLMGLILLFMSKFFSNKMVKQETEITLKEGNLFDLTISILRLLLVLALTSHLSELLVSLIILLVLPKGGSDYIMVIIPTSFTIFISLLLFKSKSITSMVVK